MKEKKDRRSEAAEGAPDSAFMDGSELEGEQREREVRMGGLLFLALLAIFPGVKVCTHRGCPWARGGRRRLATSRGQ